ncbi:hypothetical protein [Vibrio proteolyticus]|uniref:Uncharacterized protein n=1 Tax=Vibrio proteolyticus NBRC 13287 TaxID=1219065 RepID=U3A4R8_VIBPR|nr:hypothetical protein [Vibrio proteolyticus]GAD68307.1 hypothetical protein VPR01S_12_01160 [Vibrio proteolyticus NBRC 13287]
MPEAYCHCCRKITPHKMVMKRCQNEEQSVFTWFAMLFQGEHYVKMEQQAFCRVCNTRSEMSKATPMGNAHAA